MTFWTAARKRAIITFFEGFGAVCGVELLYQDVDVFKWLLVGIAAGLLSVARAVKSGLPEVDNATR